MSEDRLDLYELFEKAALSRPTTAANQPKRRDRRHHTPTDRARDHLDDAEILRNEYDRKVGISPTVNHQQSKEGEGSVSIQTKKRKRKENGAWIFTGD